MFGTLTEVDVRREELLTILERVKPGINSSDTISLMSYFFFSGTDVVSYNNRISVQYPFKTDFSLFTKASDLHKILSKLTTDTISLSEKDDKLNIKCKTMNASLATVQDDEVKERINTVKKSLKGIKVWKKLPNDFCNSLLLCSFTASKQESDGTLTCINIEGKDCISSDNNRISHSVMNGEVDNMMVKASEVKNLLSINPTKYSVQKSWLHFKNEEGCIFSIIRTEGQFPEFLRLFDFEGSTINLPDKLAEGMDVASVFTDDVDPVVLIKITKQFVAVSVKSDAGTVQYRSRINYKGEDFSFSVNPEFLKQMMEHSSTILINEGKAKLETGDGKFSMLATLYL